MRGTRPKSARVVVNPRAWILSTVLVGIGVAGCGGEVVDETGAEQRIQAELERVLHTDPGGADCPSDVSVEAEKRFRCDIRGRTPLFATVKVLNSEADLQVIALQAK
jgi:hypothetical protein